MKKNESANVLSHSKALALALQISGDDPDWTYAVTMHRSYDPDLEGVTCHWTASASRARIEGENAYLIKVYDEEENLLGFI